VSVFSAPYRLRLPAIPDLDALAASPAWVRAGNSQFTPAEREAYAMLVSGLEDVRDSLSAMARDARDLHDLGVPSDILTKLIVLDDMHDMIRGMVVALDGAERSGWPAGLPDADARLFRAFVKALRALEAEFQVVTDMLREIARRPASSERPLLDRGFAAYRRALSVVLPTLPITDDDLELTPWQEGGLAPEITVRLREPVGGAALASAYREASRLVRRECPDAAGRFIFRWVDAATDRAA
jgi:hypothetical protein